MFGCETIVDRNNDKLTFVRQRAADNIMGIDISNHPSAAVEKYQARCKPIRFSHRVRLVDPERDRAVRSWCGQ